MHGRLSVLGMVLTLLSFSLPSRADENEFASPVNRIFIPSAFDGGDAVEVILHGSYPNSCYRAGRTGAEVDEAAKTIVVWATSTLAPEQFCQQTFVSFLQVVNVGVLAGGRYTVIYRDNDTVRTQLDVRGTCNGSREQSMQ